MNFVTENSGNVTPLENSCGDRSRSSCGNDVAVKREHAQKDKGNNSNGSTCNSDS